MHEGLRALHENNMYRSDAVDGLDGSGKSSCGIQLAEHIARQGHNVIQLHLPHYSLPFGGVIGGALVEQGDSLSLEERFALYALNRLEVIDAVTQQVLEVSQNGNGTLVLWDRFWTSQFLTLAYGYSHEEITTHTSVKALAKYFKLITQLDAHFISELFLQDANVLVPMIDPVHAFEKISFDSTRSTGADKYETIDIQQLARHLYLGYADANKDQMYIIDQEDPDTGQRYSPHQMAQKLFSYMTWMQNLQKGNPVGDYHVLHLDTCDDPPLGEMEKCIQLIGGSKKLEDLLNDFYSKAGNIRSI